MARIDSKGRLTGSIGPVSYRSFNGTTYLQSKPGRGNVKQTSATQQTASDFGRASSIAKNMRQALFPILHNHSDTAFYRRFTAQVHTATQDGNPQPKGSRSLWNGNLSVLSPIDCNAASPFANYCTLIPELAMSIDREVTITLPEFTVTEGIIKHGDVTDAELAFLVTCVDAETGTQTHAELFKLEITLANGTLPAQQWTTAVVPENQLIIVAAAVFYYRRNAVAGLIGRNSKEFHPCAVISVMRSSE
jgi:hypothetical protein